MQALDTMGKMKEMSGYVAKQTKSECVYCEKPDHRSSDCKTTRTVTERRKILSDKKTLFPLYRG